jgi:hypothetical protein
VKGRAPWGLWVLLTVLVWGLFALDRGIYQDDVSVLSIAQESRKSGGFPLFSTAANVFTIDGAAVALALAPLLYVSAAGLTARALAASTVWRAALVPYGIAFLAGLHGPPS